MPTNLIRRQLDARPKQRPAGHPSSGRRASAARIAILTAGRVSIRLQLLETRTADLIWAALPLHSVIETWGDSIHFETPIRAGRERTARLNVGPGDVCYWAEDERVVLAWGPTPISRETEIRLMRPCNIWAQVLDDAAALAVVTPGEKAVLARAA